MGLARRELEGLHKATRRDSQARNWSFFRRRTGFFPGILGGAGPGDAAMHKEAEREFKSADPAAGRAGEATFAQDVLYLLRELL